MIEIVQAGQAGKTELLFSMHRFRKRVFQDKMGWQLTITPGGLEIDDFDLPETVYVLALDDDRNVIGSWRLLPSIGPTMIGCIWPHFLKTIDVPPNPWTWETSRLGVSSFKKDMKKRLTQIDFATKEMFCGLAELCIMTGIYRLYGLYDIRLFHLFKRLNCIPDALSTVHLAGKCFSRVGAFTIDEEMLFKLRRSTGITTSLIKPEMLPPILRNYLVQHQPPIPYTSSHPKP